MGLDMYLRAKRYVSGYEFDDPGDRSAYRVVIEASGLMKAADPDTPSATITATVAYWRKANAIHQWFVRNVQEGVDECEPHAVARGQLEWLRELCRAILASTKLVPGVVRAGSRYTEAGGWEQMTAEGRVLADTSVAEEHLPTQSGFFFGGTDYDEWYWQQLEDTVKQLDRVLENVPEGVDLEYQSSW